jgi:hypothetical protein
MLPRSFWPIIRCLDIMNRYKICGFKDDPSIASEYVKFLAANSGTDLLDKVASKISIIEAELRELAEVTKGLGGSSSTIMNKIDENKRGLADLIKRVAKLESQKH